MANEGHETFTLSEAARNSPDGTYAFGNEHEFVAVALTRQFEGLDISGLGQFVLDMLASKDLQAKVLSVLKGAK